MMLRHRLHNVKEDIKEHLIEFAYIYAPLIGLALFIILTNLVNVDFDKEFQSNMINISGVLSGFLFSSIGIMLALPSNKFTQTLNSIGYMKIIFRAMIIGIFTLLISMLLGLFNVCSKVYSIFFVIGISETLLSAYYLYKVSYYSGKSIWSETHQPMLALSCLSHPNGADIYHLYL